MRCGSALRNTCLTSKAMQVQKIEIIVCFWNQFYGACGLDHRGATWLLILATGSAFSGAFADGPKWAYSSEFSRKSGVALIMNTQ